MHIFMFMSRQDSLFFIVALQTLCEILTARRLIDTRIVLQQCMKTIDVETVDIIVVVILVGILYDICTCYSTTSRHLGHFWSR